MAKFKKLNKAYEELTDKLIYLNALLAVVAVKNGGQLTIPLTELESIKNKYITIEKTEDAYVATVSNHKTPS